MVAIVEGSGRANSCSINVAEAKTINFNRARVMATLMRRQSRSKKPTLSSVVMDGWPLLLPPSAAVTVTDDAAAAAAGRLTVEKMTMSLSLPWYLSTVLTSRCRRGNTAAAAGSLPAEAVAVVGVMAIINGARCGSAARRACSRWTCARKGVMTATSKTLRRFSSL